MGLTHQVRDLLPLLLLFTLSFLSIDVATSLDTINSSYILKNSETLSSNNGMFHLGFFTPTNSSFSYLGIWYMSNPPLVWVANRDQPVNESSSGVLRISEDGNLVVMNGQNQILWSTNVSNVTSSTTTKAQILDTGNLVLQENTTGNILWQSFQHPTDTLLQKMELSTNKFTGGRVKLTSWKTPQDPSIGDFSLSLERLNVPELFVFRGNQPHWRSGPWNGQIFIGIPNMNSDYLNGVSLSREGDANGTYSISFNIVNVSMIHTLTADGNLHESYWDDAKRQWLVIWSAIDSDCDVYGKCGESASCDPTSSPICSCLRGYEPRNAEEWNRQNWSGGCVRKQPLQCQRVTNGSDSGKEDGFLKMQNVKVPNFALWLSSVLNDCRTQCLGNCSCVAYASDPGIGCMLWSENLTDIQIFPNGGTDLYIRVPNSELAAFNNEKKKNHTVIITVVVIIGTLLIMASAYILWKRTKKRGKTFARIQNKRHINDVNEVKLPEDLLFKFEKLAIATNNFHPTNKLGQGGFGLVYKGILEDGQEIAVKRLSKTSAQGLEEFMNEVLVISKLQHRNLVKLLGCCIEGHEHILIYEYLPNRSLDTYIFDPPKDKILNWEERFSILEGIARGLLYLHRDSRLRIIHRDLKLSNILLDGELNPKISDFGMAKIFYGTDDNTNTGRIVGTFGYMSPEYVMLGLFSEKSDIFSFGVILLEIISRKKNTSFYEDNDSLSLLGFAWKLWNADRITYLIDKEISNERYNADIVRCIHIGLLCVQELARDRPTMTTVISMLNSETVNLPPPKQPAFMLRQDLLDVAESSTRSDRLWSINHVSLTNIHGR